MSVTLKTIAERANVSVMAASAALNNTTRTRISAEPGCHSDVMARKLSGGFRPDGAEAKWGREENQM